MRIIIALGIALAVSLGFNAIAIYRLGHASASAAAKLTTARLEGAIGALEQRTDQVNTVALAYQRDGVKLQAALQAADAAAASSLGSYQQFISSLPPLPAGCGPGKKRVDAVNRMTGAIQ